MLPVNTFQLTKHCLQYFLGIVINCYKMGDYAEDELNWEYGEVGNTHCINCGNRLHGWHICDNCGYDNDED